MPLSEVTQLPPLDQANNVAALIKSGDPHAAALVLDGDPVTYAQLSSMVGAAARWLEARGVTESARVALSLPNVLHMPVLYYAALSLGAIVVPLNPLLSAREITFHLRDSEASLMVAWPGTRAESEADEIETEAKLVFLDPVTTWDAHGAAPTISPVSPHDAAVILYTSGTTGTPKGATLTHGNLTANATTVARVFEYTSSDVFFGGLPLFHSFGQTVSMNAVFAAGASVALLPRFAPQPALELIRAAAVNVIAAVPSMYVALAAELESGQYDDLKGRLRFGISGGAPLPASTHADFDRLLGCPILEGYGLSETAPVVSFNQPRFTPVLGSVGRAIDGVSVEVRDETGQPVAAGEPGQLWVAGPSVMAGYWNLPEATAEVFDGPWFATGDVARMDEEGNIFIIDRLKDMVLRNGYSVYPREIEDVLYTHDQVRQCAVLGSPDDRVGEEVHAFVVPRTPQDDTASLVAELDALCRANLAAYKYPRHFHIVQSLPLGPTGKILKRELAAECRNTPRPDS